MSWDLSFEQTLMDLPYKITGPCDSYPCLNGGSCVEPPNQLVSSFHCDCAVNFTGELCAVFMSGK